MIEIPHIVNKVKALKLYLESNKNDHEGDSWTFGHNPIITKYLNSFNLVEYNKLKSEIVTWEDRIISKLADPISECENNFIDGNYMYCLIFMQINVFDDLEYLLQNLAAIASSIKDKQSTEFYNRMIEKAQELNRLRKNGEP